MAKTTGAISGNSVLFYNEGVLVTCTTGATLNITNETLETTCKDNDGAKTYTAGSQDWSVDISGITKFDVVTNFSALAELAMSKATFTAKIATSNADDPYFEGDGFVSSFSYEGPLNAPSTWSATISPMGPLYLYNT